ncbi:hypothetical protein R6Q59_036391 [Mikania micrantha]
MEKPVPNKHSRRHSTGNLILELTGYEDVLSRYLSAPFPSCHDNCKPHPPGSDHPTQTKPTRKRLNKNDVDSVQGLKKPFTPIPKSPTRHAKITSTSPAKHQVKSQPIDPKRQDFKSRSRSKSAETDPFYIPPTRITRRYSDVNLHADSSVSLANGGLISGKKYDKKCDSRTDVKPINSAVKTPDVKPSKSAVKTPDVKLVKSVVKVPRDGTSSKKVQTLKAIYGSTKPEVNHGSKKSKFVDPFGEVVQEKNNKSQSHNEKQVLQNGAQTTSKTEKDETLGTEIQSNSSIVTPAVKETKNPTRVQKQAKEKEEVSSQKLKFKQGKVIGSQSETNGPRKVEFAKGEVLDENKTDEEESKGLRRMTSDGVLQTSESNSVDVVLKPCDTEENKYNTRLNNVIEETAGRLIKTRKSKVQALVGAFEMISANEF